MERVQLYQVNTRDTVTCNYREDNAYIYRDTSLFIYTLKL